MASGASVPAYMYDHPPTRPSKSIPPYDICRSASNLNLLLRPRRRERRHRRCQGWREGVGLPDGDGADGLGGADLL